MAVIYVGPFWQSNNATTNRFIHQAEGAIAREAVKKVHAFQSLFFRYESSPPTGFAAANIKALDLGAGYLVTDSDIVYGPWLEGTSSRNTTTRFKGYAIFRRTARSIDNEAVRIAEPYIQRMCAALS